jgi:anaerobic magnesium-protoporphyrin IX monomethyl ester cyclase
MRVLLVYPNIRGMNMLPPAIALMSAILKGLGHEVALFDATDYPNPEGGDFDSDKLKEKNLNVRPFDASRLKVTWEERDVHEAFRETVLDFKPDLMAMSVTEDMFPIGIQLLETTADLKIPTLLGGVFPTFAPELALARPEVDMVCIGEGERVIADLVDRMERGLPPGDIDSLWTKAPDGSVRRTPLRCSVDIDSNPPLDLSIFREGRLYRPMQGRVWKMLPLETHRGCPFTCTYCNSPSQADMYRKDADSRFFRKKSLEKIREEIVLFRDVYGAEAFYFWADTFLAYTDAEFDAFVEMYSEFKVPFWCQTRPETVTRERIRKLADVGMFRMAFGIEHGNDEFRRRVLKRRVSNETIVEALRTINEVGVPFSVNNILGFPYETRELTFDTIELNRHIVADSMNAYSFSPFHGTPLREIAEREGYIEPGLIARSVTKPTMLRMPRYPPERIEGMRRCFVMYAKFPKDRWPEIEKAEALTPEGDAIWERMRDECAATYMNYDE